MRIPASFLVLLLPILMGASPLHAQSIEIFGGYSYVRAPVTYVQTTLCAIPACPSTNNTTHLNLNGWEASVAFKFIGPLAFATDFSGTNSSFHGANTHLQTYLAGPQLRFPGPISPFVHALFGAAHEAIGSSTSGGFAYGGTTQNSFATALGGGLDLKVLPFISLRPIQFDYLMTDFNSTHQHQPRVSAGLVLRF